MKKYLDVPYEDRHEVRRLGAQWDTGIRRWWIPEDRDITDFKKWEIKATAAPRAYPESEPLPARNRDSPAYERFVSWWRWWNANLPAVEHQDHVGAFIRVGAIWRKNESSSGM